MKEDTLDTTHPIVEEVYSSTFLSYLNLSTSIMFLIWHPISMLFVFDVAENLNGTTALWATTLYALAIYSIILSIANEKFQIYMLYAIHYIQGILQAIFIINSVMWILT
jgi:hypothetical protein